MATPGTSTEGSKATASARGRPDILCPSFTAAPTWCYGRIKRSKNPIRIVVDSRHEPAFSADSAFQGFVDLCKEDSLLSAAILEHNFDLHVTTFRNGTTVEFVTT